MARKIKSIRSYFLAVSGLVIVGAVILLVAVGSATIERWLRSTDSLSPLTPDSAPTSAAPQTMPPNMTSLPSEAPPHSSPVATTTIQGATALRDDLSNESQNPWSPLLLAVRQMDPGSDEELKSIYASARKQIERDQKKALQAFSDLAPRLGELPLMESFFAVSALMRYSDEPTLVLNTLLENRPPADSGSPNGHHEPMTPSAAFDRLEAYAMRELRKRIETDPQAIAPNQHVGLVSQLTERARTERSLDISIEMLQTLKALREPRAIETALSGHSRRDQDLMRAVIE